MRTLTNLPFAICFCFEHFCFTSHLVFMDRYIKLLHLHLHLSHLHQLTTSRGINFTYFILLFLLYADLNPELTLYLPFRQKAAFNRFELCRTAINIPGMVTFVIHLCPYSGMFGDNRKLILIVNRSTSHVHCSQYFWKKNTGAQGYIVHGPNLARAKISIRI